MPTIQNPRTCGKCALRFDAVAWQGDGRGKSTSVCVLDVWEAASVYALCELNSTLKAVDDDSPACADFRLVVK